MFVSLRLAPSPSTFLIFCYLRKLFCNLCNYFFFGTQRVSELLIDTYSWPPNEVAICERKTRIHAIIKRSTFLLLRLFSFFSPRGFRNDGAQRTFGNLLTRIEYIICKNNVELEQYFEHGRGFARRCPTPIERSRCSRDLLDL